MFKKSQMKKISLLLTLILVLISPINIYAESSSKYLPKEVELAMEQEIEKEIGIAMQEIYVQLKNQDALVLMGVYEEIIYPQIEKQIKDEYAKKYSINSYNVEPASLGSYPAPNGGIVTYLSDVVGYEPTEVAITGLNESDSYNLVLDMTSFTILDIITSLIGYHKTIGSVTGMVLDIQSTVTGTAINSIKANGRCAKIINTYSREFGTKASVVTGWSERFNLVVPSNARSVKFIGY